MEVIKPEEITDKLDDPMPELYREFRSQEDIPVHKGLHIDDVTEIETGHWERTGQKGAFINLYGMQGIVDIQVNEIEPGGQMTPQRHFYEEVVWVVEGDGITVVGEGDNQTTFEWGNNACFLIPKNTPYYHINASDESSARLVSQTTLPLLLTLTQSPEFIFNSEYDFWSGPQNDDFYSGEGEMGTMYEGKYGDAGAPVTWDANFVPDITTFDKLKTWNRLGATKIVFIPFPESSMYVHLSEWATGMYKNAHRHGPAANVFIRSGEGYTLLWKPEWDYKVKVAWGVHSLVTPPAGWYHQHFNLGSEPAGQFAIHSPRLGTLHDGAIFDAHDPANIIDYVEEEPGIRELYKEELEGREAELRMPEECYTNPDFDFEEVEG